MKCKPVNEHQNAWKLWLNPSKKIMDNTETKLKGENKKKSILRQISKYEAWLKEAKDAQNANESQTCFFMPKENRAGHKILAQRHPSLLMFLSTSNLR